MEEDRKIEGRKERGDELSPKSPPAGSYTSAIITDKRKGGKET